MGNDNFIPKLVMVTTSAHYELLNSNWQLENECSAGYGYSSTEASPLYTCASALKRGVA